MYKINTVLQEGGLGAASIYLHSIDADQTELAVRPSDLLFWT
eukprot:SAG31_NODE_2024_length_6644_cov_7.943621_9_plen_42_part_00